MDPSESDHVASRDFENRTDACTALQADVPYLPFLVVWKILLNLPAHQVVQVCRLVCRMWKKVVDSAAHWRERCKREGIQPCDASRPPEDWCLFYFLRGRRNLLKNPSAEDEFNEWTIVQNGGDGWTVEDISIGLPNHSVSKCFVTSYQLCLKQQLIDLNNEGYSDAFMDQVQPHIKISDWCAPSCYCWTEYQICVELLDQRRNPISTFEPEPDFYPRFNDLEWCEKTHIFRNYGPGVRFVRFTHGGRDTEYCPGQFGILVTNSSVEIYQAYEG